MLVHGSIHVTHFSITFSEYTAIVVCVTAFERLTKSTCISMTLKNVKVSRWNAGKKLNVIGNQIDLNGK